MGNVNDPPLEGTKRQCMLTFVASILASIFNSLLWVFKSLPYSLSNPILKKKTLVTISYIQ